MFAGEQRTGAAKAGCDLIGDQQNAVAITGFTYTLQIARMVKTHSPGTLNDGFQNHRGQLPPMLLDQPDKILCITRIPLVIKTALRRRGEMVFRQVAAPQAVHGIIRIAYRHRGKGIAVITAFERQKLLTRLASPKPVLQRHFHRDFNGDRAGIGQKYTFQRVWRH